MKKMEPNLITMIAFYAELNKEKISKTNFSYVANATVYYVKTAKKNMI